MADRLHGRAERIQTRTRRPLNALQIASAAPIGLRSALRFPPSVFHTPLAVATTRSPTTTAHEDQRARPAHNPAPGFDKLADRDGIDEVHVELDGRLRLALVGVPAGHAH